jgi:alkanesulfonate monooxygenase SsuD/methylene tetrahydromethanopterin reductase-like flavin-dependent oxidoreductase (luciferase family)
MQNDIQTPITESLIREVITSYDKYRGKYRLNTLLVMTPDEIIKQIAEDLKKEHVEDKR